MPTVTPTNRWRGVVAIALVVGTVGLAARRPSLLLVAVLGIVFAAYPRMTTVPRADLTLERRLGEDTTAPGEAVTVDVTVQNNGPDPVWDLRLVDGVPPALPVVDGSPRHGAVLQPGGMTTFTYAVESRYGRHRFEPATVVLRDLSGANEHETSVADETELACLPSGSTLPPPRSTDRYAGQRRSPAGGIGVEFSRSREYRRGDPAGRIDWKRYARRRELTTVLYREQRTQTVVALLDAREASRRGLDGGPNALGAIVSAAEQLATALVDSRNRIGLAALGWPHSWIGPATGRDHLLELRTHLATHRAFNPRPPADETALDRQLDELRARLPTDAQLYVLSPLGDDAIGDVARRLEIEGHPVTVLTPDVTSRETAGRRLASIERRSRISQLRRAGMTVYEWTPTDPLEAALTTEVGAWP